ncbi:YgaP-like transmembrane domain [Lysinibacillus odysseyi]|uniref:YgaP-like transmembrane domain n=1 Tax=Lysinibacillus odysseyi TaxID=202611 RepID=UPI00068B1048|nr:YgaP-like transmembrane domain [Lysinibacillus odysseyi]
MLSENISEQNGFIRMICGIALVSFGTARISRKPDCLIGKLMVIGGAMKVAEGYYQYCPVTAMVVNDEDYGYEDDMMN